MPTYEYECQSCGHTFDFFQSMSAENLTKCPECKKNTLKRLMGTGGGIIFKGKGFYATDYRSESYRKGEKNDKKSDTPSCDSAGSKKECSNCPASREK
ncbi:MAG: zinc ribbon domain-containing protein [Candidatus Omnitrophica bacterium]|nr:zinc ribbon domain-containing protein [Candidatus Omnitrophota bacterium]